MAYIVVGDERVNFKTGKFADTEWYVQLDGVEKIQGAVACVVGTFTHTSQNSISDQLLQMFFLAHQARVHGANRVIAVMPYLPYARQCKDVRSEHAGPFEAVGKMCASVGIDSVVTCEVHEKLCQGVLGVRLHSVGCENVWAEVVRQLGKNICLVSPDEGGVERVKRVANLVNVSWAFIKKRRVDLDQSEALELMAGEVKGKAVVLIDDIVDTAITVVQASEMVVAHGAKRVLGCFVHPVLSPGAVARLEKSAIERIWVCDTIDLKGVELGEKITVVPVENLVSEYVRTVV